MTEINNQYIFFITLLGCLGESTSQDRIVEQSKSKEVANKESSMLFRRHLKGS